MMKNALLLALSVAAMMSCRGGSKNAAETTGAPPPAPAPAAPAGPATPAPSQPEAAQPLTPMIGKTPVTHFRVLDVKKFRQIATKGNDNANPDLYAVNGKLLKHQPMLAELKKGATACFSRIVGSDVIRGQTLLVTSALVKQGENNASSFYFANIANSEKPDHGIVIICMKHGPITGVGFKQALSGIVELIHLRDGKPAEAATK